MTATEYHYAVKAVKVFAGEISAILETLITTTHKPSDMDSHEAHEPTEGRNKITEPVKCPLPIAKAREWRRFIEDEVQRPSYFSMVMSKVETERKAQPQKSSRGRASQQY